jgi:hypothetical protein
MVAQSANEQMENEPRSKESRPIEMRALREANQQELSDETTVKNETRTKALDGLLPYIPDQENL